MMSKLYIARIFNLLRTEYLSYTAICFLLGYYSTNSLITSKAVIALFSFHFFSMWINDLVDLEIDRTVKWRSIGFLPEGLISPRLFLLISLIQIPILFFVSSKEGYIYLLPALAFMTIYNVYGKKCKIPFITDALQGISWGCFVLYASCLNGYSPTFETAIIAFYFLAFILLTNGIHGGLRDLKSDQAHHAITASIFFGALEKEGKIFIPGVLYAYSAVCQILLTASTLLIPIHLNEPFSFAFLGAAISLAHFVYFFWILYSRKLNGDTLSFAALLLMLAIYVTLAPYIDLGPNLVILSIFGLAPIVAMYRTSLLRTLTS